MKKIPGALLLAALCAAPLGLRAQERPTADAASLDAGARRAVVDSIAGVLEKVYVSADTGRMIADHLRRRERSGAYAQQTSPSALAAALTQDLRAVNGDKHLSVKPGPGSAGPQMRMVTPGGAEDEKARRENFNFEEVKRLEGNVGYLRLSKFSTAEGALETAVHALRFLENTEAMVIDVRGVPGGSGELSNFLVSHFAGPDLHYLTRQLREPGRSAEVRTLARVPGPRRTEVPLYVLIDAKSFSAAEHFAFALQSLGRATVVGERTGGGGRNNRYVPVGHGLSLSVTYSRVFNPRTGRGWEGTGVQPDVAVPAADALEAAHRAALGAARAGR